MVLDARCAAAMLVGHGGILPIWRILSSVREDISARASSTIRHRLSILIDEASPRRRRNLCMNPLKKAETFRMCLTAEQRRKINKANASKSTGPSEAGKLRSRYNALKHGLRAEVLALPNEDPTVVEARSEAWNEFYQPQSPAAQHLVNQCVHATLLADRCQQFHGAQLEKQMREAPLKRLVSREDELERLEKLLITDPMRAVRDLQRTAHGCRWLIDRWQLLADALERDPFWTKADLDDAIHLSGRLPHVWCTDPDIYRLTVYTLLAHPDYEPEELRKLLDTKYVSRDLTVQVLGEKLPEPEQCRAGMREHVMAELDFLRQKEQVLREEIEEPLEAGLLDRSLILADPHAARLFLRYHAESRSAFHRSYSELIRTLKRDAENVVEDEEVAEPSCPHETCTACDRSCIASAAESIDSRPAEVATAPEVVPQVEMEQAVEAHSPNEANGTPADPNYHRYLGFLEMLQNQAAASADRTADKIASSHANGWN